MELCEHPLSLDVAFYMYSFIVIPLYLAGSSFGAGDMLMYPLLSGGSGLVANVFVGSRSSELPMSIRFDQSGSFLYGESECPVFVKCFDALDVDWLGESGMPLRESVRFDSDSKGTFSVDFTILLAPESTELFRASPRDRESAGAIGLGHQSPLLRDTRSLSIYMEDGDVVVTDVPLPSSPIMRYINEEDAGWSFNGEFVLGSFEMPVKVIFDPSETGIVISRSAYSRLEMMFQDAERQGSDIFANEWEQWYTPKRGPDSRRSGGSLLFDLTLAVDDLGLLDSAELVGLTSDGDEFLDFQIADDGVEDAIVVGSKLLSKFKSIELFPKRKMIGFTPRTLRDNSILSYAPLLRTWLVPLFTTKCTFSHDSARVEILFTEADVWNAKEDDLYILRNAEEPERTIKGGYIQGGWVFLGIKQSDAADAKVYQSDDQVLTIPGVPYRVDSTVSMPHKQRAFVHITADPANEEEVGGGNVFTELKVIARTGPTTKYFGIIYTREPDHVAIVA